MDLETKNIRSFWLTLIVVTFLFDGAAIRASLLRADELGMNVYRSPWGGIVLVYLLVLVTCVWLFVHIVRGGTRHLGLLSKLDQPGFRSTPWRGIALVVFGVLFFAIPLLKSFILNQDVDKPFVDLLLVTYLFYWMCWWMLLLAMAALKVFFKTSWPVAFISVMVVCGVAYETWIRLGAVTLYPLSMGWSEGSRYYYASLYFSKWVYGESIPLSTLHPTRYFLQSIPFLIPSLGLPAHRFWQFLLWIVLTGWAALSIAGRVTASRERPARWLIAGGLFIFFLRTGVYYHLEPMVILPMLFVSGRYPVRSSIAIIAASLWAGISRVNWFPMPAMIAIAIYLLETPVGADASTPTWKRLTAYLSLPAVWTVIGLVFAFLAQVAYIPLSGNGDNADAFASSLTSDLLWYRLLPNVNHELGILPATLLFTFPLILTIILAARQGASLHAIRWLGLTAMLVVLFAGSLVVSAKIGGGGDLHNMDTYVVMIGVVSAYLVGGQVTAESGGGRVWVRSWSLLALFTLIPLVFILSSLGPRPVYHEGQNEEAYRTLTQVVRDAGQKGPVLLINERQLLTFGSLNVPFVADYETVTLMEMAMSGNTAYLERFYNDLQNHRFSVIVTTPQNLVIKTEGSFKEENNVWNRRVAPYILCHYMPSQVIDTDWNRIAIYIPDPDNSSCP